MRLDRPAKTFLCRLLLLFSVVLAAFPAWCGDYGFTVERAELQPVKGVHVVNADIAYQFSPTAIEALLNGVPLTLAVDFSIIHPRAFWLAQTVLTEQRGIQIRYYPLAESYQILDKSSGASQNFTSLSALLDTLSRIRNWLIPPFNHLIKTDSTYMARLRVKLDIESLPLPLRIQAYVSPDWHQDSPTYEWPIKP